MSKSLGNGIDPLEVIDKYGADALRLTLMTGNAPGNDMRFYWERVEASRNFANKVWNASRFIMMNLEKAEVPSEMPKDKLTLADKWILSKVNTLATEVTDNMDKLRARHRRTESLRLYLGGILRLVHRDGKTASVQRRATRRRALHCGP